MKSFGKRLLTALQRLLTGRPAAPVPAPRGWQANGRVVRRPRPEPGGPYDTLNPHNPGVASFWVPPPLILQEQEGRP